MDTTLAASLVLISIEVNLGDTKRWYEHLVGAQQIIMSAKSRGPSGQVLTGPDCFKLSPDGEWLLRHFAYHDVLGAVTMGTAPLIPGTHWLNNDHTIVDSYVGFGSEVLAYLSEICILDTEFTRTSLAIDKVRQNSSPTSSRADPGDLPHYCRPSDWEYWLKAFKLENKLQTWDCRSSPHTALVALAEAYRSSALIFLYRKLRARSPQAADPLNAKIAVQVRKTVRHLENVPVQALPECGLLFPLFMAGGDTMDEDVIGFVRLRLKNMLAHRGFGNIEVAMDVLEELWRMKASGLKSASGCEVDWMDVLKRKGWKLMLS
jgi:hypothetical protein